MAAPATWTENQLKELARDNYYQHDGQEVRQQGRKVADIMPFGLANVGAGFGEPAPIQIEDRNEDIDFDFPEIRIGAGAGGILSELRGGGSSEARAPAELNVENVFEEMDVEDFLAEPFIEDVGVEEHKEIEPDLNLDFDVEDLDVGGLLEAQERAQLGGGGRQINYANVRRMNTRAFGFRRRLFFYEQLRRMRGEMVRNVGKYSGYQLSTTFSSKKSNADYANGVAYDFGTTNVDGETRRIPFDADKWDFDIHDRRMGYVSDSFSTAESQYVRLDDVNMVDAVIDQLIRSMEAAMPRESDSGSVNFSETNKHLMNVFMFKFLRPVGGGLYDISKDSGEVSFSRKAVFNPKRRENQTCFWECLVYFLYVRYKSCGRCPTGSIERILRDCDTYMANHTSHERTKMRVICWRFCMSLVRIYCAAKGKEVVEVLPLPLSEVDEVLLFFGCEEGVLIMDSDGEALIGDIENAENKRMEDGYMLLIWYRDHFHLVLSYTGALVVKKCRRCDMRFKKEESLKAHLESNKCMTCPCRGSNNPFESESEWRSHMESREELCPRYRILSKEGSIESTIDEKGRKVRFLNDQREDAYSKKKREQDALEKDYSPFRVYDEAVFFDLESVVPMNKAGTKNADHDHQVPYACGWITRSEALNGEDVRISYGEGCMGDFVDWLDAEYEKYFKEEVNIWFQRSSNGVMADPIPRKTKGFTNYAWRVKTSWDKYMKSSDTPGCMYCGALLEKEHGYKTITGNSLEFSSCALRVYARNAAEVNMCTNNNNNAPRISVFAHNGGKYDWVFFHRYLMEKGRLDDLKTVRNSSKYFQLIYKDMFILKDSIYFMMGSLDKLGKDFNVETLKGIFPYRLLSSIDRIDKVFEGEEEIRSNIPHEYFQISEKIKGPMGAVIKRDMNEEEYADFFQERGWVYDVKKETNMYLSDDVMCLFQVVEKFRQGWLDMPNSPKLFEYCTIGQMCHTYFLTHYLPRECYPCLDVCEDAYIRRALYGGRTEVFRRVAPKNSKIHYVDVNSLYPYVMESRDLPCGDPVWHFRSGDATAFEFATSSFPVRTKICSEEFFEQMRINLNSRDERLLNSIYGFVEVDVLCNLICRYPVLPERRSTDNGKTFKNMFTNMRKSRMVYYTEELKRAIRRGYIVTRVWSYSEWGRGRVYGELIGVLKAQKLLGEGKNIDGETIPGVEKNPSLRAAAKVAQNSLFGKTIQFIDSGVQLVHTRERLFKSINAPLSKVSIKPVFRSGDTDVVEVTTKFVIPKVQKRSCAALGTAILAEARLVLYDYFDEVEKIGGEILYCDTDSIVFAGDNALPEECMHDCLYGKMKVEIDPDTIQRGGFVGMSPKCYAFKLNDGSPYVKCKGVNLSQNLDMLPAERDAMDDLIQEMNNEEYLESLGVKNNDNEVMTKGLNYEKMRSLILGEIDVVVTNQLQFLKTTARNVSAYDNVKMLRSNFDKRFLGEDGETFPWNDFNMNMEEIIKNKNNRALSDYLNVVMPAELIYLSKLYKDDDFFSEVFSSWLQSDSSNVLEYQYEKSLKE